MYKHDHSKQFINATRAAIALAALSGGTAHAQATQFNINGTASQLGAGAGTVLFPAGVGPAQSLPSPLPLTAGSNRLTFTAQGEPTGLTSFESVTSNGMSTNFAAGTQLLNTFDGVSNTITGPLQIDFAQGVTAFGFSAEDEASDTETFTFTLFNGATQLFPNTNPAGGFTSGPVANFATFDNMGNIIGGGKSVFLGAQATGGNVITRVVISSLSQAGTGGTYTGNSNDFVIGPVSITPFAPVPEASTSVSCGMGVLLFAGLIFGARKRKVSRAS